MTAADRGPNHAADTASNTAMNTAANANANATADPDDPYVVKWADQEETLAAAARNDAGLFTAMARRLIRPGDQVAVDVGCGAAGMAIALARELPDGRVYALDGDPEVLRQAREACNAAGLGPDRVEMGRCDLDGERPMQVLGADRADVIWAARVLHHAADQQRAVGLLAAALRPGGRLALAEGGLRSTHLPWDVGVGEPGLELRLEAAQDRWFARMRAALPGVVPMPYGWTEALARAGLTDIGTWNTPIDRPAPLVPADRAAVAQRLRRHVDWLAGTDLLDDADLAAWERLLDPEGPDWLGNRTDIFHLEVRSVHVATRPKDS
jgi:SAM-dependent methyltransferase